MCTRTILSTAMYAFSCIRTFLNRRAFKPEWIGCGLALKSGASSVLQCTPPMGTTSMLTIRGKRSSRAFRHIILVWFFEPSASHGRDGLALPRCTWEHDINANFSLCNFYPAFPYTSNDLHPVDHRYLAIRLHQESPIRSFFPEPRVVSGERISRNWNTVKRGLRVSTALEDSDEEIFMSHEHNADARGSMSHYWDEKEHRGKNA